MRESQETRVRGQRTLADLRSAIDRLERTRDALSLYEKEIGRWAPADAAAKDSLAAHTDRMQERVDELLARLRLPEDTKGIVEDSTATARLATALGRAVSTPDRPAPGRMDELRWALAAVDGLLQEIERFYAVEVPEYRDAVRAAGFDPLGGAD